MFKPGEDEEFDRRGSGWDTRIISKSWRAFGPIELDDYNEIVNFYFELSRASEHPRKGCSRGIEVQNVQESELPEIFAWLRQAAERNAERFSRLPPV